MVNYKIQTYQPLESLVHTFHHVVHYSPGDKCVFLGEPCMGVRGKFYCLELFIGVIVTQNRSMPLWHP